MNFRQEQINRVLADCESGYIKLKVVGPSTETKWIVVTRSELRRIQELVDGEY